MRVVWQPKKTKFKRLHKGTTLSCEYRQSACKLQQGAIGLKVLRSGSLTSRQLEQVRRKISRVRKKKEKQKIWFRSIPDIPITAKPLGIRMGKGKGQISYWISRLTAGKIIFHVNWMSKNRANTALKSALKLLPVPTQIISCKTYNKKFLLR